MEGRSWAVIVMMATFELAWACKGVTGCGGQLGPRSVRALKIKTRRIGIDLGNCNRMMAVGMQSSKQRELVCRRVAGRLALRVDATIECGEEQHETWSCPR
jgi:hypothetical protein